MVQRHQARALHFDLRLEHQGALASWAVPKGPPLREGVKRLAVHTEDHPLMYLDFAAVIPEGQYGAGRMTIWDHGTYEPQLVAEDEWKLVLEGSILRGHYHLVRTRERSGKEEWLIFRSGKGPPAAGPGAGLRGAAPDARLRRPEKPFDDPAFRFELKWDGYRGAGPRDLRRDGAAEPHRARPDAGLPGPARTAPGALLCQEAVLDGEVVVLGDDGSRTSTRSRTGGARSPTWCSTCCTWTGSGSATSPGASGASGSRRS